MLENIPMVLGEGKPVRKGRLWTSTQGAKFTLNCDDSSQIYPHANCTFEEHALLLSVNFNKWLEGPIKSYMY
jgi:hypothetical protein